MRFIVKKVRRFDGMLPAQSNFALQCARKCKKGMHTRLLGKCNLLQLDVNGHLGAKSSPFRLSSTARDKTFDRRSPFRAMFTEKLRVRPFRRKHSNRNGALDNGHLRFISNRTSNKRIEIIIKIKNKTLSLSLKKYNGDNEYIKFYKNNCFLMYRS